MKTIRTIRWVILTAVVALPAASMAYLEKPYEVAWIRQIGTSGDDLSYGVSADSLGNVYISGETTGSLGGPNAGSGDAFVSKYDSAGNLVWTRQLGSSERDESFGVSADSLGNVYISGYTLGSLGGPNAGGYDAFVSKYDSAGNLLWCHQVGTSRADESAGVSADTLGNVYISGVTFGSLGGPNAGSGDAFVSKYGSAGNLSWSRQLGTSNDEWGKGVSADSLGNVYISGYTYGSLGGPSAGFEDAFVSKYDSAGNLLWTRQLGTSQNERGYGVSADSLGNVYISGETWGSLGGPNAGSGDAFVSKYDSAGNLSWTRQLGTSERDLSYSVSADSLGNVYISGYTYGSLGGPNAGVYDAFVSKYDSAGDLLWTRQFGTGNGDWSKGVSADSLGNVYISGVTWGSLAAPNVGFGDAFVAKLVVPEPATAALLGLGFAWMAVGRRRQAGRQVLRPRRPKSVDPAPVVRPGSRRDGTGRTPPRGLLAPAAPSRDGSRWALQAGSGGTDGVTL